MNLTYETINIFFLLIPGFIGTRVFDAVVTRKDKDNLGDIIEALVFSFLVYTIASLVYTWEPLIQSTPVGDTYEYALTTDPLLLVVIAGLSVLVPLIIGTSIHNDWHTKLFRLLRITDKTSRATVWQDSFINEKRRLVINLKDERRIYGWPMFYPHEPEGGHIYLFQPAWIDSKGNYIECGTHGMLIKIEDIDLIEFVKNDDEDLSQIELVKDHEKRRRYK